ncbi:MAG: T9SS type A sorting domain-containing protein [Chitinophagales bacterium]|nr:T9SS type A sorting domain-containing protein [Chitinophagales bacterium]
MKKNNTLTIIFLLVSLPQFLWAQLEFNRYDSIIVLAQGDTFKHAWSGGLNCPQFSEADLNNDSVKDLVVFNRGSFDVDRDYNGNHVLTFINKNIPGQVSYEYAPFYQQFFPGYNHWMLMFDFNCDGKEDIATSSPLGGIDVYFCEFDIDNHPYFTGPNRLRYTTNNGAPLSDIPILYSDIPGFADVNNDGDMDVLAFDNFANAYVNYFENMTVENGFICGDTLLFNLNTYCYGVFSENPTSSAIKFNDTSGCSLFQLSVPNSGPVAGSPRHAGSTLCAYDKDGDGDKDLLIGDVNGLHIIGLTNGGNPNYALMVPPADTMYPSYNYSVQMEVFPAPFCNLDVNNDGKKDVLVAPNLPRASENWSCSWYYQNISNDDTVRLDFQTDTFLIDQMVDLGEGAYPAIVDISGDGLKDLVVGNGYYFVNSTTKRSGLAYFKNVGSINKPVFELVTRDLANVSSLQIGNNYIQSAAPAFADMDNDGDMDMLVGNETGEIQYYTNTAGAGNQAVFSLTGPTWQGIDAGGNSVPFVFDVNGDSLPDLLIGNKAGVIYYYPNRGTLTSPDFDAFPINYSFGNIDVRYPGQINGWCTPAIAPLDSTGKLYVLAGNEEGKIAGYEFNPDSILSGSFPQVFDFYSGIDEGERVAIAIGSFSNNDKYDMVTGNYRGGLTFYSQSDRIAPTINDTIILVNGDTLTLNGDSTLVLNGSNGVNPAQGDTVTISNGDTTIHILITTAGVSFGSNDTLIISPNGEVYFGGVVIGQIINVSTGIDNALQQFGFMVYPNPANDVLFIRPNVLDKGNRTILVQDLLGRVQLKFINLPANALETAIDISTLAKGVYFCHMQIGDKKAVQKFVVQ